MTDAYNKLRNINKKGKLLLGLIQKNGPITRNQIMDITKMKLTTLKRFMQPLLDGRLVVEADTGESTGGRPPTLYDVNPKAYFVVGIDISRTYSEIVVTNLKAELLDLHRFPPPRFPEETVCQISEYLDRTLERLSADKSMLLGVGVGTVGPLNREKGIMLNPAGFLTDAWANVPIKDMVQQKLQLPVIVDNGANAAVLAEHFFGMGRETADIAYFHCGVGIRTGIISSGTIVRTINDYEDAFGHMTVDFNGELCHCGNYGCIEAYCSIPSITKKFIAGLKNGRSSSVVKPISRIDYLDTCAAAEHNDEFAREIIITAATIFGIGLANYINILNPRLVILSGPLIKHSPLFYETCVNAASKRKYIAEDDGPLFSRGGYFKENAIAMGAAVEFIEKMLNMQ